MALRSPALYPEGMSALDVIAHQTAEHHRMLPEGAIALAMVSGGADSVAVLRLLAADALGRQLRLSALHVNHQLRGEASDADEDFVRDLCAGLGVELRIARCDVAELAEREGLNLEDAGRQARQRLADAELDARCADAGAPRSAGRIVVAHTFDDRLETFLARLVSGAGPGGLRSIAPVRGRVVRPLIEARRADVVAYLTGLGQAWREDASNADVTRERAWVRHELLPVIEARNPAFAATAARTLRIVGEEDDLLGEMAEAFAHDFTRIEDGMLILDRHLMRTLSRPMARRTMRAALLAAFPEASRLEFEHTEAIMEGLADDAFARDLPFGLRAEAEYGKLNISRKTGTDATVAPGLLGLPGMLDLGAAGTIESRVTAPDAPPSAGDGVSIDADAVTWPLLVDSLREGDRIRPFGMTGSKKVGDLLTDEKVPRRLRGGVPIVRDGDRIVWVAGVRLAEDVRVTARTARAAELRWRRPQAGTYPLSGRVTEPGEC